MRREDSQKVEHLLEIDGAKIKVIIQTPKKYQNRIIKYGWVLSLHDDKKFYKLIKKHFGPSRFGYSCDCEDNFYRGRICKHISAFKLAEGAK